mmetsp:Transcript_7627/g.17087  ORF Transcript_7627/g.17087 Transcript_7627/m.17087 type:complete len:201 (-) Transcript_7627:508-1110(-)
MVSPGRKDGTTCCPWMSKASEAAAPTMPHQPKEFCREVPACSGAAMEARCTSSTNNPLLDIGFVVTSSATSEPRMENRSCMRRGRASSDRGPGSSSMGAVWPGTILLGSRKGVVPLRSEKVLLSMAGLFKIFSGLNCTRGLSFGVLALDMLPVPCLVIEDKDSRRAFDLEPWMVIVVPTATDVSENGDQPCSVKRATEAM